MGSMLPSTVSQAEKLGISVFKEQEGITSILEHNCSWKVVGVWNVGEEGKTQPIPEKSTKALRFVCMSDTHGNHNKYKVPHGDFFLHAGDWSDFGNKTEVESFITFLDTLPHQYKIVIAGNHEATFDPEHMKTKDDTKLYDQNYTSLKPKLKEHCIYLENEYVCIEGVTIYGSPHTLLPGWAFGFDENDPKLETVWKSIPSPTHVLITHNPPAEHGGITNGGSDWGCKHLLATVKQILPLVHLFGHVHAGYGHYTSYGVTFLNAANFDGHSPIVFDLAPNSIDTPLPEV